MNKIHTICLRCGKVQVRTDIIKDKDSKYTILNDKINCPECRIKTNQIATKNVQELRKKLEDNPETSLDCYVYKLIKRRF